MMYRGKSGYLHKKFLDGFDELGSVMPHVAGSRGFYGEFPGDYDWPPADSAPLDHGSTLESRLEQAESREDPGREDRGREDRGREDPDKDDPEMDRE